MTTAIGILAAGLLASSLSLSAAAQTHPVEAGVASDGQARMAAIESCLPDAVVVNGEQRPCESLAHRMQSQHVHGVSIAVIHEGAIAWAKGYGVSTAGGAAVTTQTLFQAGSISKPVAAMAALKLVQQGQLSLDADVNRTLHAWKVPASPLAPGAVVTLCELLSHTSGLGIHGFPGYALGSPVPTLVQVLNGEPPANTKAVSLESRPGSRWNYSGGGYTVMQLLMQEATRQPFAQWLHEAVLAPLGMRHSTYEQPLPASMGTDVATPYAADGQAIPGGAHTYPEMAAAGLWSTPSDLALYVMDLQQSVRGKGRVLDQRAATQMLTAGKGEWGLGIGIGGSAARPYFQHFGVNEGFESLLFGYRDSGEGVVVMTNAAGGAELARDVLRATAVAYGWPDYQPVARSAIALDPPELTRYVGTYQVEPDLDIRITLEHGQLMSQLTDQRKFPLFAASHTRFFTRANVEFEFVPDAQGRIGAVVLHQSHQDLTGRRR